MLNLLDQKPTLQAGDIAPDFTLPDANDQPVHLAERIKAGRWMVIFFYPKDNTPGCTKQACSFRNAYSEFKTLGADILGISGDSGKSHQAFSSDQQLPYPLLSDSNGEVAKAFGVKKALGLLPGRVTFVIDPQGVIQLAYSSQLNAEAHAKKALAVLKSKAV